MKKILTWLSALLLFVGIGAQTSVQAHGLFLYQDEPGVFRPEYDGGGNSPRMEVTIYDADDNELDSGNIDDDGLFHYDADLEVAKATVDDGMGHYAEWEPDQKQMDIPKVPVIIAVFVVIGLIFWWSSRRKESAA